MMLTMLAAAVGMGALGTADPLNLPTYEQRVTATFATPADAAAATCRAARLPDDAEIAVSCRWDDTNPNDTAKAAMMNRAGMKGTFYFVARPEIPYFHTGPAELIGRGHAIGNHTCSHPFMMELNANAAFREIARARILLECETRHTVMSYVSPYGWQTDPFDADFAPLVAERLVASGHYVSEDAPMPWSRLGPEAWMPANRFSANDRHPDRALFEQGYAKQRAAAKASALAPRLTLGTHALCDAAGDAVQEALLKEHFAKPNHVAMNDWEYGSYRYEALHGKIAKTAVDGCTATFAVTRFAPAGLGGSMPLSLIFTKPAQSVRQADRPLARAPRGTWTLPHDATHREPTAIVAARASGKAAERAGVTLTAMPDETAGTLTVRLVNGSKTTLADIYLAAPLPPVWRAARKTARRTSLKPGDTLTETFALGARNRPEYAFGRAFYPVSADFTTRDDTVRLWVWSETEPVACVPSTPLRAARVWGPGFAATLANTDWAAVSVPEAALPDAENWNAVANTQNLNPSIVARRARFPENKTLSAILAGDHARYIVYDFTADRAGAAVLHTTLRANYRHPALYVNGAQVPFRGRNTPIVLKRGANRILLRGDVYIAKNDKYTDTVRIAVEVRP